jgi:hypothetical protein
MVEVIRSNTLEATGRRTYSETDPFIDVAGNPTADESLLADLMVGLGGIFVAAGMGIAGAASRR